MGSPVKLTTWCGKKAWEEGLCGNYQGLLFKKNTQEKKLFFRSSKDREVYYKKHLQGKKEYSKFIRYSICSTKKAIKGQSLCGKSKNTQTTRRTKRLKLL